MTNRAPITHGPNGITKETLERWLKLWQSGHLDPFKTLDSNRIPIIIQLASAGYLPYDVSKETLMFAWTNGEIIHHVASLVVGLAIPDSTKKIYKNMDEEVWCQEVEDLAFSPVHWAAVFDCLPNTITEKMWNLPIRIKHDFKTTTTLYDKYGLKGAPKIGELSYD